MNSITTSDIVLSTPVSHSDWIWRNEKRIGHKFDSIRYVLDRLKAIGFQKLYWRCFDGGKSHYASKLMADISDGFEGDNYHAWSEPGVHDMSCLQRYEGYDTLEAAVRYGHEIGLEIHAWLTINEDDHAWGIMSRFARAHPQFRWVKRMGWPYNSQLSFAFEEVREYKLALVNEILQYDVDGFFFDWIRTGDIRNDPQVTSCGTADYGYEKPLVESFEKEYGVNPRQVPNNDEFWVRHRTEPHTIFMRQAHQMIKAKDASLPIGMMGHHSTGLRSGSRVNGNLYGLLLDVNTWAQEGLIDSIVAAGYFYQPDDDGVITYDSAKAPVEKAFREAQRDGLSKCDTWLYWWMPPTIEDYELSIAKARELGATQLLYWESDYVDLPEKKAFADAMVKRNR